MFSITAYRVCLTELKQSRLCFNHIIILIGRVFNLVKFIWISTEEQCRLAKLDPLWKNFLDPRMLCSAKYVTPRAYFSISRSPVVTEMNQVSFF